MTEAELGLLLIHPAVTTEPELLAKALEEAAASGVQIADQFLITKINDKSVAVEDEKYDVIYYLTPEKRDAIKFPATLIPVLADALKPNGKLYGLPDTYKLDALINGFTTASEGRYHWVKSAVPQDTATAVPLKARANGGGAAKKLPSFKRASSPVQVAQQDNDNVLEDEYDDDNVNTSGKAKFFADLHNPPAELIEEEELVADSRDPTGITMITCGKTKTRRKKACKDCTCGMKEQEEQEVDQVRKNQDAVVKFSEDELTEIDFTIEGKKVGGCNSCSLGDAFRCSGCPYLGLPAFKPGQKINIGSILDDI
ncbi:hypothetical protein HG536_0H02710 [Torulaspora globosa]|uniref:Uncharacterized protein n=1 Tax=Torulaspora globosa TaxID=48254 RepID=A0A7G3ZN10_9SACH|nr:uncharacterized protein HG536_0H02710 [Torulaspora globosa]QLL34896.1 hypothetical protein HG536_0H02710 [Torulaspora globosa]